MKMATFQGSVENLKNIENVEKVRYFCKEFNLRTQVIKNEEAEIRNNANGIYSRRWKDII